MRPSHQTQQMPKVELIFSIFYHPTPALGQRQDHGQRLETEVILTEVQAFHLPCNQWTSAVDHFCTEIRLVSHAHFSFPWLHSRPGLYGFICGSSEQLSSWSCQQLTILHFQSTLHTLQVANDSLQNTTFIFLHEKAQQRHQRQGPPESSFPPSSSILSPWF